jgi:ferrous iron transport protein A
MSMVSVRLSARRKSGPPSGATDPEGDTPLAELRPGMSGRITGIDASVEPATARRLCDLGFAPGAEVTVLRKAPLGDPVVFQVVEYEVALRKEQAAGIRVRRTA